MRKPIQLLLAAAFTFSPLLARADAPDAGAAAPPAARAPAPAKNPAADRFFLGRWAIASTQVAPWAQPEGQRDEAQRKALLGKSLTFAAKGIRGPAVLACPKADYKLVDSTPDMLFQGAFEELHGKNAANDPAKLAASVGFKIGAIRTLETGCELDFHFVDERTAEFGLNDFVYTIKRAAPAKPAGEMKN